MSIKSYFENGENLYSVYVNLRSKSNTALRIQKRSHGFKTKASALQEEKRLLRSISEKISVIDHKGMKWDALLEEYEIAERKNPYRTTTIETFTDNVSLLNRWTKSLFALHAKEIGKCEIRQLLNEAQLQGKSRSFQVNLKAAISGVYRWAIDNGKIKGLMSVPTEGVSVMKKIEEKIPEILNIEEIRKLISEARSAKHPWYHVWAVALLTGMRSGELYALSWPDIDMKADKIFLTKSYNTRSKRIKCTKKGYWRTIPISSELKRILEELKASDPEREWVLPRFRDWNKGEQAKVLKRFCKDIGLKPIKFHTLRACFATQLLGNGVQTFRVQKICGWKDIATMQRYVRLAGIDEKGATESLSILTEDSEAFAKVAELIQLQADT